MLLVSLSRVLFILDILPVDQGELPRFGILLVLKTNGELPRFGILLVLKANGELPRVISCVVKVLLVGLWLCLCLVFFA